MCVKSKPHGNTQLNSKQDMYQPLKTNCKATAYSFTTNHTEISWLGFNSASSTGLENRLILSSLGHITIILAFSYSCVY